VLRVLDPTKIPFEVNGKPLWILDEKALTKLLKAGLTFPGGSELVAAPTDSIATAAKGRGAFG